MTERSSPPVREVGGHRVGPSSDLPLRGAPHFGLLLEADPGALASVRHHCVGWLRHLRWPEAPIADAVTALNSAVTNSVRHAYWGSGGQVGVHALAAFRRQDVGAARFTVRDWGTWRIHNPSRPGYGMFLMEELSDDLYIETGPDGTTVVLTTPIVALSGDRATTPDDHVTDLVRRCPPGLDRPATATAATWSVSPPAASLHDRVTTSSGKGC